MASETITFQTTVTIPGDRLAGSDVTATAEGLTKKTITLTSLQVDKQFDIAFDKDNVKAFVIHSTVNGTLETNATDATGGNTITFYAGEPFIWRFGFGTNPFTQDVATAYLTGTSSGAATVKIWYLLDPIPD
jgi:hypothetical protein